MGSWLRLCVFVRVRECVEVTGSWLCVCVCGWGGEEGGGVGGGGGGATQRASQHFTYFQIFTYWVDILNSLPNVQLKFQESKEIKVEKKITGNKISKISPNLRKDINLQIHNIKQRASQMNTRENLSKTHHSERAESQRYKETLKISCFYNGLSYTAWSSRSGVVVNKSD